MAQTEWDGIINKFSPVVISSRRTVLIAFSLETDSNTKYWLYEACSGHEFYCLFIFQDIFLN